MEGISRRDFVKGPMATSAAVVAAAAASTASGRGRDVAAQAKRVKIIGVCCSPRKAKTTAASLRVCLQAAKEVGPNIHVELIELAGLRIEGSLAAGIPLRPDQKDDFGQLIPKLSDPVVGGIIIGTPVYFGSMTSLCKAFLDRCIAFRKNNFALSNKVAGVLAVGAARNGGQELTIQSVQAALLCQEMIIVGDARPGARIGATVWNDGKDDVTNDEFGMASARNLGRRVAEVSLRLRGIAV
jgi:multimeric flavodoxin WrbA